MKTIYVIAIVWTIISILLAPIVGNWLRAMDDKHDGILDEEIKNQNREES